MEKWTSEASLHVVAAGMTYDNLLLLSNDHQSFLLFAFIEYLDTIPRADSHSMHHGTGLDTDVDDMVILISLSPVQFKIVFLAQDSGLASVNSATSLTGRSNACF